MNGFIFGVVKIFMLILVGYCGLGMVCDKGAEKKLYIPGFLISISTLFISMFIQKLWF